MPLFDLVATAGFGREAIVGRELADLGYAEQQVVDGRVTFRGDDTAIARSNLWLRTADRVLIQLAAFEARDFGALFDQTKALPWADWLPVDAKFPVRGKSVKSQLHSIPDCQAIVKKAIVESLKSSYKRDWFEETGAEYSIEVAILKDQVRLSLDTTGPGLHKRGYRPLAGPSPIKETLAAALVQLSFWKGNRPLVDPFCGTGTIPIEAALFGKNIAPGLNREFHAEHWPWVSKTVWDEARTEARDKVLPNPEYPLIGTDIDSRALDLARYHAKLAGVESCIHFQQKPFAEFTSSRKYGCVIANPPYGERSGDLEAAEAIYRDMARVFAPLDTWSFFILTSHDRFETIFGRRADRRRKLYNGRIQCTYYQYHGPRPPRPRTERPAADESLGNPPADP